MMRSHLKTVFKIVIWAMSVLMASMAMAEAEVFTFTMVEKEKPEPIYMPGYDEIVDYTVDDEEVGILSKLLWSSPLTNETYKKQLCWIVLNRVLDNTGRFGDCIEDVVNIREFAFYDRKAHRSETNDRIAREQLVLYENLLDGKTVVRDLPLGYVFIRFSGDRNQTLMCYQDLGGVPYDGKA